MKKMILIILFALFTIQANASMRCAWLETKAAFTNDAMLAADQASKETFCKLGNHFMKYADAYIDECKGESNLGMQGTMGMMINNKQIVQEKCRGYTRTVSDDVKDLMYNNIEKTSSTPATTNQLSDAEKRELEELRREKSEKEKAEMQRELEQLRVEKEARESNKAVTQNTYNNLEHSKSNNNRRYNNYPFVCYDKKFISGNSAIYNGCVRSASTCKSRGQHHFGKYPNDSKAHAAFKRCFASNPKFVDIQGL